MKINMRRSRGGRGEALHGPFRGLGGCQGREKVTVISALSVLLVAIVWPAHIARHTPYVCWQQSQLVTTFPPLPPPSPLLPPPRPLYEHNGCDRTCLRRFHARTSLRACRGTSGGLRAGRTLQHGAQQHAIIRGQILIMRKRERVASRAQRRTN